MRHLMTTVFILLLLSGLGLTPTHVAAQQTTETMTIQVDARYDDQTLVATYIVTRSLDGSGQISWTMTGMYDGVFVKARGTAVERWAADGSVQIELLTLEPRHSILLIEQLPTRTISIGQQWSGLITIVGVPFAVQGTLRAPGQGSDPVMIITNAGQGIVPIASLPNTAAPPEPAILPFVLAALVLIGIGLSLDRTIRIS